MSLLTLADPAAPVRLVTGDEVPPAVGVLSGGAPGLWWGIGFAALVLGIVTLWWWRALRSRSEARLDQEAAAALAKQLGLSRGERKTLWELAGNDTQYSALELLVSVKHLLAAVSRRAEGLSDEPARESLRRLCRALGAEPPTALLMSGSKPVSTSRNPASPGKTPPKGASRAVVVAPRLIDRRG